MGHVIFKFSRAGGIETNPATFSQRAATFASAIANTGQATLLTRRETSGLNGYLILPADSEKNNAPLHLAHTVGARADLTELPTDLGDTPAIGELHYVHSPASRETQSGIDPTELPRLLGHTLTEGSWVAVTMRKPTNGERNHHTAWLSHRLGTAVPTHHSISPSAMIVSIAAGGATRDEVKALLAQVTAGLPGFDLETGVHFAPTRSKALLGLPAAAVLAAGALIGLPMVPADIAAIIPPVTATALLGIAAVLAIAGVLALTNRIRSADTKLPEDEKLDLAPFMMRIPETIESASSATPPPRKKVQEPIVVELGEMELSLDDLSITLDDLGEPSATEPAPAAELVWDDDKDDDEPVDVIPGAAVFIDVDGSLAPFQHGPGMEIIQVPGHGAVGYRPEIAARIGRLPARQVYLTDWEEEAPLYLGNVLPQVTEAMTAAGSDSGWWKIDAALAWLRTNPQIHRIVWIGDELSEEDAILGITFREIAEDAFAEAGIEALLLVPDSFIGMTDADLDLAENFLTQGEAIRMPFVAERHVPEGSERRDRRL